MLYWGRGTAKGYLGAERRCWSSTNYGLSATAWGNIQLYSACICTCNRTIHPTQVALEKVTPMNRKDTSVPQPQRPPSKRGPLSEILLGEVIGVLGNLTRPKTIEVSSRNRLRLAQRTKPIRAKWVFVALRKLSHVFRPGGSRDFIP